MNMCEHMNDVPKKTIIGDYMVFCELYQCPRNISIGDCSNCKDFKPCTKDKKGDE